MTVHTIKSHQARKQVGKLRNEQRARRDNRQVLQQLPHQNSRDHQKTTTPTDVVLLSHILPKMRDIFSASPAPTPPDSFSVGMSTYDRDQAVTEFQPVTWLPMIFEFQFDTIFFLSYEETHDLICCWDLLDTNGEATLYKIITQVFHFMTSRPDKEDKLTLCAKFCQRHYNCFIRTHIADRHSKACASGLAALKPELLVKIVDKLAWARRAYLETKALEERIDGIKRNADGDMGFPSKSSSCPISPGTTGVSSSATPPTATTFSPKDDRRFSYSDSGSEVVTEPSDSDEAGEWDGLPYVTFEQYDDDSALVTTQWGEEILARRTRSLVRLARVIDRFIEAVEDMDAACTG